jgi:hypothetical protein
MDELAIEDRDGRATFAIRVSPRASKNAVGGVHDGALKIAVTAPPVDGEANEAIVKLLSKRLGVPKRAITIVSGATGRDKRVAIEGVTADAIRALAR